MTEVEIQNRTEELQREGKRVMTVGRIMWLWLFTLGIWAALAAFDVVERPNHFLLYLTILFILTANGHMARYFKRSTEAMMDFQEVLVNGYEAQIKELQAKVTSLSVMKKILNRN